MNPNAEDALLTVSGAARVLAALGRPVSSATVRLWADSMKLPAIRTADGVRLFRRCDVELMVSRRPQEAVTA